MAWDDSPHMKTHGFQVSGEQASGELMKFAQITLAVTPTSDFSQREVRLIRKDHKKQDDALRLPFGDI